MVEQNDAFIGKNVLGTETRRRKKVQKKIIKLHNRIKEAEAKRPYIVTVICIIILIVLMVTVMVNCNWSKVNIILVDFFERLDNERRIVDIELQNMQMVFWKFAETAKERNLISKMEDPEQKIQTLLLLNSGSTRAVSGSVPESVMPVCSVVDNRAWGDGGLAVDVSKRVVNIVAGIFGALICLTVANIGLFCRSDTEPAERIQDAESPDPADMAAAHQSLIDFAGHTKMNMHFDEKTTEAEKLKKKSHEEDTNSHQESEQCSKPTDGTSSSQFGTVVPDLIKINDIYDTRVTNDDEYTIYNVQTDEKLIPKEIAIVEGDYKETTARVREIVKKMINRQPDNLEELEFRLCDLKKEHLKEFLLDEVLKAVVCKISKLSIGYTKNVTDLIPSYCRIASNYKSTKLSLVFNDLKNEDIKALIENLDENEEYEEIDMSYNRNIGPAGFENIGKIVEKHRVRVVRLADCNISDDDLYKLFDGMGDAKLEVLDISCTNNMTAEGFAHIGKQVAQNSIKRLKLSDTQLNLETLSAFFKEVKGLIEDSEGQQVLVEEIDVSYNSEMEPEAYQVLGLMVKLFGVTKISLAGCGLKKKHLQDFREKINSENPLENTGHYTKMQSLNAGDNTSIGKGIVEIAKIVNECQLEELDISECRFTANELKDFVWALEEAKTFPFCSSNSAQLKILYLGEERQFDKNYISQVCNLLPHIAKVLCLKGTVRNNLRKMLQDKLNRLGESELEIKLDDDMTLCSEIEDEVLLLNSS